MSAQGYNYWFVHPGFNASAQLGSNAWRGVEPHPRMAEEHRRRQRLRKRREAAAVAVAAAANGSATSAPESRGWCAAGLRVPIRWQTPTTLKSFAAEQLSMRTAFSAAGQPAVAESSFALFRLQHSPVRRLTPTSLGSGISQLSAPLSEALFFNSDLRAAANRLLLFLRRLRV